MKTLRDRVAYKDAWVSFINALGIQVGGWEWFSTLTFRIETPLASARKRLNRFHHKLNRRIFGNNYTRNKELGISSVVCIERQIRGVIHFHSLDAGTRNFRRLTAMDIWEELAGHARIRPYRTRKGSEKYITKYILKGAPWNEELGSNMFLMGPFRRDKDMSWPSYPGQVQMGEGTFSPIEEQ